MSAKHTKVDHILTDVCAQQRVVRLDNMNIAHPCNYLIDGEEGPNNKYLDLARAGARRALLERPRQIGVINHVLGFINQWSASTVQRQNQLAVLPSVTPVHYPLFWEDRHCKYYSAIFRNMSCLYDSLSLPSLVLHSTQGRLIEVEARSGGSGHGGMSVGQPTDPKCPRGQLESLT